MDINKNATRRLLLKLSRGQTWQNRAKLGQFLGRDAGVAIQAAIETGAVVTQRIERSDYLAASWRVAGVRAGVKAA